MEQMKDWTPASKNPVRNDDYIVTIKYKGKPGPGSVGQACWYKDHWSIADNMEVLAWMEQPGSYKEVYPKAEKNRLRLGDIIQDSDWEYRCIAVISLNGRVLGIRSNCEIVDLPTHVVEEDYIIIGRSNKVVELVSELRKLD